MRRLVVVVAVVLVALLITVLLSSPPPAETVSAPVRAGEVEAGPSRERIESPREVDVSRAPELRQEPAPTETEDPVHPTCVVLGIVVDEGGAPIAGASVRLSAYKVWTEGLDVPRLEGRYDLRGFESRTDVGGAFRIEAPVPTAERAMLTIRPGPFHDSHEVRFAAEDDRAVPPLREGERDLGVIRLASTGAIRGRVTSHDGRPLEGVEMGIGSSRSTTYGRDTQTLPDGSYLIAHAPEGTYGVKARLEGYLSEFRQPVTVETGRTTEWIDFVLRPAPTIEGRVTDAAGRPVGGVRFHGWPLSSGRGASGKSEDDGSFVIYLPQDEPYTLSASSDGYATWGNEHDRSVTFAPGERGIEVVMTAVARTRFRVVDAETDEPVEHFGLRILADNGSRSPKQVFTERRRPRLEPHPGGVAEATGRPGLDLYVVAAEGYLLAAGDVEHDPDGQPEQTVRLRRGATLRGRVLAEGGPVAGARVEVERGSMRETGFRARSNTLRAAETDAEGRFVVTALERGDHRLRVYPARGAPLVVAPIEIGRGGQDLDLGDLHLQAGGAIEGRVLVPPGVDPSGLRIYLDDWRDEVTTTTDGAGAFRFANLAPGSHAVMLGERPGVLAASEPEPAEVPAGGTVQVELDARDRGMCSVRLTIVLEGLSPEGMQVDLVATDGSRERERLGNCDEDGVVVGAARGWGEAKVVVWVPGSSGVEHPTERLLLRADQAVERTLHFASASMDLQLPVGIELPRDGHAVLTLAPRGEGAVYQKVRLQFSDGVALEQSEIARDRGDGLRYGFVLPGSYEMTFELIDRDAQLRQVPVEGGGIRIEPEPFYRSQRSVQLAAGKVLTLLLD